MKHYTQNPTTDSGIHDITDVETLHRMLGECLYKKRLMLEANQFWEQFSDHMVIAISFLSLGIIIGMWILYVSFKKRIRVEHDMPRGTMMRMFHEDKKWFIARPKSFMQVLDLLLLCMLDRGKDKYIDKHKRIRISIIRMVLFTLLILFVLSGVMLILSAFAWSMNPFDYINMDKKIHY